MKKRRQKSSNVEDLRHKKFTHGGSPFAEAARASAAAIQSRGEVKKTPFTDAMETAGKKARIKSGYLVEEGYKKPFRERVLPTIHQKGKEARVSKFDIKKRNAVKGSTGVHQ